MSEGAPLSRSEAAGPHDPKAVVSQDILDMRDARWIGRGGKRNCYVHPRDASRCVKIERNRSDRNETLHDLRTYGRLRRWRGTLPRSVAACHGAVLTSLGPGAIFDLIRDEETGRISRTLGDMIDMSLAPERDTRFDAALTRFREELIASGVVAADAAAQNICVQERANGTWRFVLIDGIGRRNLFPYEVFLSLSKRKVRRLAARQGLFDRAVLLARYERYIRRIGPSGQALRHRREAE